MRSFVGSKAWLVPMLLIVGSLTACDDGSTDTPNVSPSPPVATVSPSSPVVVEEAPVDDPATEEIEVVGELLAQGNGEGECSSAGDVSRCVGAPWEGDYSMSEPRLSGHAEVAFTYEMGPGDRFRWWYTGVLRTGEGVWEGLNTGQIKANDVHVGDGVYLGSGALSGLEFHEHTYIGPGADTSRGDAFEVTGYVHEVAVEGWSYDPSFPTDGLAETVRASTAAWDAHDGGAAGPLYAKDAVYVNGSETHVGRSAIASVIAEATEAVGFELELLPPLVVRGNYAAGAFHWTNDSDEGWVLGVFRFDEAGLIAHHEVIAASD